MSKSIFVLGAAITDMMGFPFGKPLPTDSVPGTIAKAPGGAGRNLAENLARLGLRVELVTAFGDDRDGRALLQNCQDINIGVRHSILANGYKGAMHLAILDERKDLYTGVADLSVLQVLSPTYLEQQREALEQADKVKTRFLANMSYEFRTPLTSIKGALGLIDTTDNSRFLPAHIRLIDIARSNADRLSHIVNDILDLEKISSKLLCL